LALNASEIDYVLIFAWNYETEIVAKQADFLEDGGRFIVPLPSIRVLDSKGTETVTLPRVVRRAGFWVMHDGRCARQGCTGDRGNWVVRATDRC